ncbi:phosphatase PAP2 family protein [Halomonas caseinilytica]|uniref:phosphatase PAP2 family protein n=1 Tax=Halomonas caseinilytica TaxID=438744 RepID=UPI0007E554CF|nr:phosphatase PAP2 family protein [Halomonas caseinilytica]SEM37519.1 lipid-A kinase [Halomonas caseinilytica]
MKLSRILLLNVIGMLIITSWWLPSLSFWTVLDDAVFWWFNQTIGDDNLRWTEVLAALNSRRYDILIMLCMLTLMGWASYRDRQGGWRRWFGIGVTMLITAGLVSELVRHVITYGHPSPTLAFDEVNLVSSFVEFATKDQAGNSFPGDHGIMSMIFAGFMLTFGDRVTRLASIALAILATAPRVMVGAHWLSDVLVGSLSICLLLLPWVLCTPLASRMSASVMAGLERLESLWPLKKDNRP